MDTHRETDRDTVSFVAGAALVGIGMYVLEDEEPSTDGSEEDKASLHIDLEAGPSGGMMTGTWAF